MPEFDRFERVVQKIVPQGRLLSARRLSGGISAEMTALQIARPDGGLDQVIVRRPGAAALKLNPNAARDEFQTLQLTHSLGLATQTPYILDESGAIFPAPYLVMEYIEGQPEFAPADAGSFAAQVAEHLARIHSADCTQRDVSFLPGQSIALGARPAVTDESLAEGRIRDILGSVWPIPQHNPPALLHGDFWPGNLLWRAGQLVAVIDWEDACFGDPLIDLAITRLDILWIYGPDTLRAFMRRYQSIMAIDATSLPYWDLWAALRLIRLAGENLAEWAEFFTVFKRSDITEQTIRAYYWFFISQALEQLE